MTLLARTETLVAQFRQMANIGLTPDQQFLGKRAARATRIAAKCEYKREMNRHLRHAITMLEEALAQ